MNTPDRRYPTDSGMAMGLRSRGLWPFLCGAYTSGMKGLGSVYMKTRIRKDGGTRKFWVAQMTIEVEGHRKRIEGQGKTPQAAIDARTKATARALDGKTQTPKTQPLRAGTLGMLITEWNETRTVSQRTREHAASVIKNHIANTIGHKTVKAITEQDIRALLANGMTPWSQVDTYKALHSFMTYAIDAGVIAKDPMTRIKRPKTPRAKYANAVEMEKAVKRIRGMLGWMKKTHWMDDHPMYWCRIMLALNGLRPGEVLGLTWDSVRDLNAKNGIPRLVIAAQLASLGGGLQLLEYAKDDNSRVVVLRKQTVDALRTWRRVYNGLKRRSTWNPRTGFETLVLVSDKGRPLRAQTDSTIWRKVQTQSQKTYKTKAYWPMEYTRHVAITLMRDVGIPEWLVAQIVGHTVAVENAVYYHSRPSAQYEALQKLDEGI